MPAAGAGSCNLAIDGRFELNDLPAGLWHVFVNGAVFESGEMRGRNVYAPLATVRLKAGETKKLEIDGSRFRLGELTGLAFVNGRPFADGIVFLARFRQDLAGRWIGHGGQYLKTDAMGRFSYPHLDPMHYRIELRNDGVCIHVGNRFACAPGQKIHKVVDYKCPRVRLHLVEQDGKTGIPHLRVEGDSQGLKNSLYAVTDANGWVDLPFAPVGKIDLRANRTRWSDAQHKMTFQAWRKLEVALDPIDIQKGTGVQVFTRKVPPKR